MTKHLGGPSHLSHIDDSSRREGTTKGDLFSYRISGSVCLLGGVKPGISGYIIHHVILDFNVGLKQTKKTPEHFTKVLKIPRKKQRNKYSL